LIVGLLSIGCLVGTILAAPLSDWIGRKKSMLLGVVIFYIGNTIQITAFYTWYQIGIGRFICGLAVGSLSGTFSPLYPQINGKLVLVPVYQSETAPRQIRGALVATYQLFITMGILTSYCINLGTSQVQDQSGSWPEPSHAATSGLLGTG
jgi:MFS transporter, SP family, sugar:H+ symporter